MKLIDGSRFDALTRRAQASPRRRMNENFHADEASPAHRLLNAIEPDSYVRPHRHLDPAKDETILCLRGRLGCILFDPDGRVRTVCELSPGGTCGIDIPHGEYHSVVALESGTVMFEAKAGPYVPPSADEFAPWAPAPDAGDEAYLAWMASLFDHRPGS